MRDLPHDAALHLSAGSWAALLGLLIGAALTNWAAGPRLDAVAALAGCVLADTSRSVARCDSQRSTMSPPNVAGWRSPAHRTNCLYQDT